MLLAKVSYLRSDLQDALVPGTATVPVLQPLFLKPESDAVSMIDIIYQEGFGIELLPFIVFLYSERYTGKRAAVTPECHEENSLHSCSRRAARHPQQELILHAPLPLPLGGLGREDLEGRAIYCRSISALWCTVQREDHPRSCCSSTESTSRPMGHLLCTCASDA